jgi:fibro-slime domain-containing protein
MNSLNKLEKRTQVTTQTIYIKSIGRRKPIMLKFINLKKLTSRTLLGILIIGSFIAGTSDYKAVASSKKTSEVAPKCSNNGHGNNAPITITLSSEKKFVLEKFDPSNPGDGGYLQRELANLKSLYPSEITEAVQLILQGNFDVELKPSNKKGCDTDGDGIDDLTEAGSNLNSPVDTDNDGIPDFVDSDSDNDGVSDKIEGTGDTDNDGIPNYKDKIDISPSIGTSSSGSGSTTGTSSSGSGSTTGTSSSGSGSTTGTSSSGSGSTTTSNSPSSITLTGTIRDFESSHPDFEKTIGNDREIVTTELGADKKPIYGNHSEDKTLTTTGKANFDQWYRNVPGINESKEYSIELTRQSDDTYKYQNNQFFPINGELLGNFKDSKNYHFTYEIHTKFTYVGGETFTFSGDDDVWVYINNQRVIDIGGVHSSQSQSVNLDSLGLTPGQTYDLDFFFAERHYSQSNFTITTNIELKAAPNPDADDDNDGITNILEGSDEGTNSDNSGTPDYQDNDADNNGVLDQVEVGTIANPSDSDVDGTPNFQDTDNDNNGILDTSEIGSNPQSPTNTDGKDFADYQDMDDDNDKIPDQEEMGDNSEDPTDTDGDETPDYHDTDSDGDTLPDSVEGKDDFDDDDTPNFLDDDSDNDSILDSIEGKIDSSLDQDTYPNFLDEDSDGDGINDLNENIADSNGDDESDVDENDLTGNQTPEDVDGDGKPNYLDDDSDNDGIKDKDEANADVTPPGPYIPNTAD